MNLSNAAVSESVKNLEAHLGIVLLQRTSRHLHVTDEGREYYHRCIEILDEVARAESDARTGALSLDETVRVEATIAVGETIIGPLMTDFTRRFPSVRVSLSLINSPRNIVQYGTDVAIRGDMVDNADLWALPVFSTPYVVCASPRIAAELARIAAPDELDPALCLGLLMDGHYSPQPWRLARGTRRREIRPRGPLASNSTSVLIDAAERSGGSFTCSRF